MKYARKCPKCQCAKLWVMNPARLVNHRTANTTVPFGLAGEVGGSGFLSIAERAEIGPFEAWLCSQCGFTEFYTEPNRANAQLSALARVPGTGIFFVDQSTT